MKLELTYQVPAGHRTSAALLRGSDPAAWLAALDRWGLQPREVNCYVLPTSVDNTEAAGLFVCFSERVDTAALDVLQPYRLLGDRLYLPCDAALSPPVTASELQRLLLWERQVFHPGIGLVGFGKADQLDLAGLLEVPREGDTDWTRAHPGQDAPLPLQRISVVQPPVQDLLDQAGKEIGNKPLDEVPGGEKEGQESATEKAMRDLQKGMLKGAMKFTQKLNDAFSGTGSGGGGGSFAGGSAGGGGFAGGGSSGKAMGPGMLERFQNWLAGRIENLEEKRKAEIDRLMDLFENNPEEALKYAIPINDPYENRGTSAPSAHLGRRNPDFNLGQLGGGRAVDNWDVGNHYADLRRMYMQAAQDAVNARNFRKAAYIYAQLLGDYPAAANVLEQGGHFREAAAIHKDHLKNVAAAAACLEKGGLLLEAIDLYLELGKDEKAADLYVTLKQRDQADLLYEKCAQAARDRGDFVESARLYQEKMEVPEMALSTFFDGWLARRQTKVCLTSYLKLYLELDKPAPARKLEEIYQQHVSRYQETDFLVAMTAMYNGQEDADFRETARSLFYEIISGQAERGDFTNLHRMQSYQPDDQLVHRDVNRYVSSNKQQAAPPPEVNEIMLDKTIEWRTGVQHRGQFLALGVKNERLHLARANVQGEVVYYSWPEPLERNTVFKLQKFDYSDKLLLTSSSAVAFKELILPTLPGFEAGMRIFCPVTSPAGVPAVAELENGNYISFFNDGNAVVMGTYRPDGSLLTKKDCTVEGIASSGIIFPAISSGMLSLGGSHYLAAGNYFLKISDEGDIHYVKMESEGYDVAVYREFPRKYAVGGLYDFVNIFPENLMSREVSQGSSVYLGEPGMEDLMYIGPNLVVLMEKRVEVYGFVQDTAEKKLSYDLSGYGVCLMESSKRDQVAVLELKGRICFFSTKNDGS